MYANLAGRIIREAAILKVYRYLVTFYEILKGIESMIYVLFGHDARSAIARFVSLYKPYILFRSLYHYSQVACLVTYGSR